MKHLKKYLRLIIGIVLLIVGLGFMAVPFIPIGYIFIFVAAFFLATYIPPLNRLLKYMKEKDKKGRLEKLEHKVEDFEEKLGGNEDENDDEKQKSHKKESKEKRTSLDIRVEKVSNKKKERNTDDRKS